MEKAQEKIWTQKELEKVRKKVQAECYKNPEHSCKLGKAEMYDHDGGNFVEDKKEKQWVYFSCSKCDYQWALWKLLGKLEEGVRIMTKENLSEKLFVQKDGKKFAYAEEIKKASRRLKELVNTNKFDFMDEAKRNSEIDKIFGKELVE